MSTAHRFPVMGAVLALFSLAVVAASAQPEAVPEPLSSRWQRSATGTIGVFVSPDGRRTVTVNRAGLLTCFNEVGAPAWSRTLPGVDRVAASRGGSLTLAYAVRRPLQRQVHFLDERGEPIYTLENEEPVQVAIVAPAGHLAAVATRHSIIFCSRSGKTVKQRRVTLTADIQNIQFGPGDSVYVAARNPDYVALVKGTGKVLWKRTGDNGAAFAIAASEDGKYLGIAGQRPNDVVAVTLLSARDERLWSSSRPGRSPRIRISLDGSAVLLAYEHKVEHRMESRFERRLAYFGRTNQESWTKGGAFNAPLCLAIDQTGDWVVVLDIGRAVEAPRFRLYGARGERRWLFNSQAPVLIAVASSEGRHIAAYRADGILEMIQVEP